jgi:hypothetical protein
LIHSWLFLTGPFLGAAVAAFYFSYFHFNATNGTGFFAEKAIAEK